MARQNGVRSNPCVERSKPVTTDLIARRAQRLGPNVPTFYKDPVHLVRGEGVWLWDASGKKYLDCYNNVPHVGHCHPKVVEAISRQAATLNTHTRYLHDGIVDYLDRLTAKFDHDLTQGILTCTGSEANDIALRMAQAVTGKRGFIATDNTYHGNTTAVSHLSTRRPPIGGYPDHIRLVPAPDSVRPVGGTIAVAALITRPDIMAAFREAFGYFNTFGGNPVSCAAAMATLDVIEEEDLVHRAAQTGQYTLNRLRALDHPFIVQTRGIGLFFGVELCLLDGSPASDFAAKVVEGMRMRGVLINRIGRNMNTLKMRPPMPFAPEHANIAVDTLAEVLQETPIDG
ncbi:UNVERIFIED_CONTAM: hypothetical protein GTU68_018546 [Idotea baltica]|nr:hypothetical protein [Idotea baltica]